jgi:hypothetical protein
MITKTIGKPNTKNMVTKIIIAASAIALSALHHMLFNETKIRDL